MQGELNQRERAKIIKRVGAKHSDTQFYKNKLEKNVFDVNNVRPFSLCFPEGNFPQGQQTPRLTHVV